LPAARLFPCFFFLSLHHLFYYPSAKKCSGAIWQNEHSLRGRPMCIRDQDARRFFPKRLVSVFLFVSIPLSRLLGYRARPFQAESARGFCGIPTPERPRELGPGARRRRVTRGRGREPRRQRETHEGVRWWVARRRRAARRAQAGGGGLGSGEATRTRGLGTRRRRTATRAGRRVGAAEMQPAREGAELGRRRVPARGSSCDKEARRRSN
jgi:hypothetical protein